MMHQSHLEHCLTVWIVGAPLWMYVCTFIDTDLFSWNSQICRNLPSNRRYCPCTNHSTIGGGEGCREMGGERKRGEVGMRER